MTRINFELEAPQNKKLQIYWLKTSQIVLFEYRVLTSIRKTTNFVGTVRRKLAILDTNASANTLSVAIIDFLKTMNATMTTKPWVNRDSRMLIKLLSRRRLLVFNQNFDF